MQNGEPTITDVLEAISTFSTKIDEHFDGIDKRFDRIEGRVENIEKTMATKEDLGELRSRMIDHVSSQNMKLETNIATLMRAGDKKLCSLVGLMVDESILTKEKASTITDLEPFPQAV